MVTEYAFNEVRGCSYYFGQHVTNNFLKSNKLVSLIRAHEAKLDGFQLHFWRGQNQPPSVITLFSAPNYCDVLQNKGAYLCVDGQNISIQQFKHSNHPYILPHFKNVFEFSMPFIVSNVLKIMDALLLNVFDDND